MPQKNCPNCKIKFNTILWNKIYCSPVCLSEHRLSRLRKNTENKKKKLLIEGHKKPTAYLNEPWSPNEEKALKVLKENGFNSKVISEVLGRTKVSVQNRSFEKSIRFKSKMNITKDNNIASNQSLKSHKIKTKPIELHTENKIINKLIEKDFMVYNPSIENLEYDLVIFKNNKFFKIQLKTASFMKKYNNYACSNANFFKSNKNKVLFDRYKYPNIDFFIINCIGTDYSYVFPNKLLKQHKSLSLRFFPDRIRQHIRPTINKINTDEYLERFDLIK